MIPPADVVFVSMPFGPIYVPSIGLGLLKASIADISSRTFYFGFGFASRIGVELYQRIAYRGIPDSILVGEWVFQPALFPETSDSGEAYVEQVLRPAVPEEWIPALASARNIASAYVDECVEQVLACDPRIVAFTDVFQQNVASLALASRLKARRPEILVLFGGANCEGVMGAELVRRFPFVGAAVSGEADRVFPALVRTILAGEPLAATPGVHTSASTIFGGPASTTEPVRNLDALPYPDFDEFFEQLHASSAAAEIRPRVQIETSRGCWWGQVHHCTFCGLNGGNMGFRAKSSERALAELEHLVKRYPGYSVMVSDNILDVAYFRDFLPELARRRLNVRLFYEVKANLKKPQLRLLRDAGVTQIQPGIESLSDSVLGLMRKGIRGLQNIQLLKWCKEIGVLPLWHFLWGFPGEQPEEYARMAKIMPLLSHLEPPRAALAIRLDRFSPNYEQSAALGFANVRPAAAYGHIYPFEGAALRNMAYYFDYDYQEPRDVQAYTQGLQRAIADWRTVNPQSELFVEERDESLWIWDLRPVAVRTLTVLEGLQRSLYLACDEMRSLSSLSRYADPAAVSDALAPLLEAGLMIRDGDSLLSLAIGREAQESAPPESSGEKFTKVNATVDHVEPQSAMGALRPLVFD